MNEFQSRPGAKNGRWRGGRVESGGYVFIHSPGHPRVNARGYVREHILVVERVLGHLLPLGAQVHHVNSTRNDNRHGNLVACQDQEYHRLLHRRQRARTTCGHADWLRCWFCGKWDAPANLAVRDGGRHSCHRACDATAHRLASKEEK